MTKPTLLSAILLLPVLASSAFAHPVAQTAEAVLHANEEAMGDFPRVGTLRVQSTAEVSGLKGTQSDTIDLATGMFIDDLTAFPLSGASGFDGKTPWMRDISGVSITQEGGDRIPVAVNEAFRNANLWWRADRAGAQVSYVGREKDDGRQLDHLSVTPQGGSRFDAWFDADSLRSARALHRRVLAGSGCSAASEFGDFSAALLSRLIPSAPPVASGAVPGAEPSGEPAAR